MMRLRLFLKNSAKAAPSSLNTFSFIYSLWLAVFLSGCNLLPSEPTYTADNLSNSVVKIAQDEYKIHLTSKLAGQTLWIYLPLGEDLFVDSDKPQESISRFDFKHAEGILRKKTLNFVYDIREIPETKESQNKKFNPKAGEKINKVLRCVRRVIFSLKRQKNGPQFFVVVATDTKNGFELIDTTYIDDLKKVLYEMISWIEYQYRTVEDLKLAPEAIGDLTGKHLEFYDVDFERFLIEQIKQRLRVKFNRSELPKGVDIEKEVLKSIRNVFEIYNFDDFLLLDMHNLASDKKISFSRAMVLEKSDKPEGDGGQPNSRSHSQSHKYGKRTKKTPPASRQGKN